MNSISKKISKKILVFDDDESILEVIKLILEEEGYKVMITTDCSQVTQTVNAFSPDLVLLDLWMKSFDGREVVKWIRAEEELKDIPVIFISALNDLDKIAKESEVNDFIRKPFELNDLLTKVRKHTNS